MLEINNNYYNPKRILYSKKRRMYRFICSTSATYKEPVKEINNMKVYDISETEYKSRRVLTKKEYGAALTMWYGIQVNEMYS